MATTHDDAELRRDAIADVRRRLNYAYCLFEAARDRAFQDAAVHAGRRFELERIERVRSMLPKPPSSQVTRLLNRLSGSWMHAISKSVDRRRARVLAACRGTEIASILSGQTLRTQTAECLAIQAWAGKCVVMLESNLMP